MNKLRALQAMGVAALLLLRGSTTLACKVAGPVPLQVDSALAAVDTVAPVFTQDTQVELFIHDSDDAPCSHSSCDGVAFVKLKVVATDDRATPERIGYRLTVAGGEVPRGITLPTFDTLASGNVVSIPWSPELSGEDFRFELSIAPVDDAGNVGAPQRVVVERHDGGGCALRPGGGSGATSRVVVIVMVVSLLARPRRRRRSAPAAETTDATLDDHPRDGDEAADRNPHGDRYGRQPPSAPESPHVMSMLNMVGAGLVLFMIGCASARPPSPAGTAKCGDQCTAFNCPQGSRCVLTPRCAPVCEQETLPIP